MATTAWKAKKPDEPAERQDAMDKQDARQKAPFIVDGIDPSLDPKRDADERLAWMEKQQEAMKKGA